MRWRVALRRRVVVNLVTGTAIEGVLLQRTGPLLRLADCTLHEEDSAPAAVDGEIVVERARVAFIQVMPGGG